MGNLGDATNAANGRITVEKFVAYLNKQGITEEELGRLSRLNYHQGYIKNRDEEIETVDLFGITLSPSWDEGPKWPVVTPGPAVKAPAIKPLAPAPGDLSTVLVLPDMQVGFYRSDDGLEPIHDEAGIDLAVSFAKRLKPDRIVLLGDNLDLPEFGRYRLSPAFQQTTQAAIDYTTALMGRLRAAAPGASIDWLAGNHEERLPNWALDNARAAFGLRQGLSPEGWPVLSVPHLCRLDDYGVTYTPGYPASSLWVTPKLRIIHGDRTVSRGSTAHKYLGEHKTSVIYGHVHRIERGQRKVHEYEGPLMVEAYSPGCLARTDGAVPSTRQGVDLDGRPLPTVEDWHSGFAVVTVDTESGDFDYEQVHIKAGRAWFRGKTYDAT